MTHHLLWPKRCPSPRLDLAHLTERHNVDSQELLTIRGGEEICGQVQLEIQVLRAAAFDWSQAEPLFPTPFLLAEPGDEQPRPKLDNPRKMFEGMILGWLEGTRVFAHLLYALLPPAPRPQSSITCMRSMQLTSDPNCP